MRSCFEDLDAVRTIVKMDLDLDARFERLFIFVFESKKGVQTHGHPFQLTHG
jgi:hypothetical protein